MLTWTLLKSLTVAELSNVRRDSFLRWVAALPVVSALLLRWLVPAIDANIEIDLRPYFPLIMSVYATILTPVLIGFLVGMVLLDERDEGTLYAVRVTPLTMGRYLTYKLSLPVVVTTVLTLACFPLAGLVPFRMAFPPPALLAALWAPMLALLMVSLARNTIQGFVLMRVSTVPVGVPAIAWFIPSGWQYAFAVVPSYWPLKAFWLAAEGQPFWTVIAVGAIVHAAGLWWLLRRFQRVLAGGLSR